MEWYAWVILGVLALGALVDGVCLAALFRIHRDYDDWSL